MRTTVVDVNAKLMVTNGIVQVNEAGKAPQSVHSWLKMHMEQHPSNRYELVVESNVTIELGIGDSSRPDLNPTIIQQFDRERMNFGEELRVRLITTSLIEPSAPAPASISSEPVAIEQFPKEEEMWMITRLPQLDLEAMVEQSLTHEPWRVIIAYCELKRRNRSLDPKLTDGLYQLARAQGFRHNGELIEDFFRQLAVPHFGALLDRLSRFNNSANKDNGTYTDKGGVPVSATHNPIATGSQTRPLSGSSNSDKSNKTKEQKPLYKIWWVWLIFLFVVGTMMKTNEPSRRKNEYADRVTFGQAKAFMQDRCAQLGHSLIDAKESDAFGRDKTIYAFLILTSSGQLCISGISEIPPIEVMATDCGNYEIKLTEWNSLQ